MLQILYVCTHNRCRSILSEAITNQLGQGQLLAKSAGSEPASQVHALTLAHLQRSQFNTQGLYSKSLQDVVDFKPDIVFTLCDSAAQSPCPVLFTEGLTLHWNLSDPSLETDMQKSTEAFTHCMQIIQQRVAVLLQLKKTNKSNWRSILSLQGAL